MGLLINVRRKSETSVEKNTHDASLMFEAVNTRNAVTRWQRGGCDESPTPSWLSVPKPSLLWLKDDERRCRSSAVMIT